MNQLRDKTLIMLVGPSAIGKSTLMNEVVSIRSDFGRTTGFTTRDPRPNDEPGQYRYLTKDDVQKKIAQKSLIQYAVFPTTGQIYGTETIDYPSKYNLKDILANAVADFRALPFARTVTISLAAPAEQWQQWFLARYPKPSQEAKMRLEEAKLSIEWSLQDEQTHWLINSEQHLKSAAAQLVNIATHDINPATPPNEPHDMLELIEKGVWPA